MNQTFAVRNLTQLNRLDLFPIGNAMNVHEVSLRLLLMHYTERRRTDHRKTYVDKTRPPLN